MDLNKLIAPSFYNDSNQERVEFEKIFSKQWIFAAMEDDLPENNMFLTLNVFKYPIVLQNFNGIVKAFENICPHRFNLIQTDTIGKKPFFCQYHSWSFGADGKPKKSALKHIYDTDSEKFKNACVKNITLEKVGKFYFINISNNPIPIKEYLGLFYDKLFEISYAISSKFYFDDDLQNVNWKIVVENVIEAYHCPSIHHDTLYGMGFCRISENNQQYDKGHSVADYPKNDDFKINKSLSYLENRVFKHDTFRHYFIFPNLLISSTEGTSIYIGNVLPISSDKTTLRKRFYDVNFIQGFQPKNSIHTAFLEMAKTSINTILKEDKEILENIQKNMPFVKHEYILGNKEQRLIYFHNHYIETIT